MLQVTHLTFAYPDGTLALRDVTLTIDNGEKVGLIGGNGAGKTTLLLHLNGCFHPQSGDIVLDGVRLTKKSCEYFKQRVGLVFQNPDDQLFCSRLYDDVAFGPTNQGLTQEVVAAKVSDTLRMLGVWDLRDKPPYRLSQGQKRFGALGSVLSMEPAILTMDEPTSDLDPKNRRMLIGLLEKLDNTIIAASHDLDFIWDTCSRTIVLQQGGIVADGPTKSLLSSEELMTACGLELPLRLQ